MLTTVPLVVANITGQKTLKKVGKKYRQANIGWISIEVKTT